eukprot:CAMPEP_0114617660 /NCGR_PEP_ID=MMETSP0168-20121206/7309_1 /TAXON_ID=95228 ORGANISM="Vannella sp., Strain DIVA3 517/6/12" /NCGR_SAMPLE_ID=MMETSP0168 /ASSEMBLY_ACC=CAM_ASM_000044 /LENGTH=743 /DNA_ID=CAMNT_0001828797 /DNA_START=117 /DNA_END=2345 /DNA_ORIENTATION=-
MSTTQTRSKKSSAAAKKKAAAGTAAAPAAKPSVESKSKLLLTLKDDVVKLTKAVQSEHAERLKVQEWLAHTLKPGLAKQFADIREDMETQQQVTTAVHKWIRDNKGAVEASDPEGMRMQLTNMSRELEDTRQELENVRKEVAIEREARQQMLLWMRECFGRNLELLDVRIQAQVAAAVGSSTGSSGGRKGAGVTKSSSATVVAQAAEIVPESMSEWLRMIGYDRYIAVFKKYNMDDLDKCSRLEDRHLVKMGIDLKRHRSDIVSEIKALKAKLASKKEKDGAPAPLAPATPQRVKSIVVEAVTTESPSRAIDAAAAAEEAALAQEEADRKKREEQAAAAAAASAAAMEAAAAQAAEEEEEAAPIRGPTVDPFSDTDVERKINREEERRRQWEEEKRQWMEAERERMRQEIMEEEERKLKAEKERLRREAEEEVQREVSKQQARLKEEVRKRERELEEEQRRLKEREHERERAIEKKKKRLSMEREKRTTPKRSEVVEDSVVSVSQLTRKRRTRRGRRTPHRSDRSGSESESASDYLTEGSDDESFAGNKRDVYGEPSMHDLSMSSDSAATSKKAKSAAAKKTIAPIKPAEDFYSDDALAAAPKPSAKKANSSGGGGDDNKSNAARVTEVKSDYSPLDWVVFDFDKAGNAVKFGATGEGGLDEMTEYIDDGKVQYGLLRLVEEDRRRVKFVFLVWLGPSSGVITKARSQTHKAAIMQDIGQFHLELISENRDELNLDEVWKRLK